MAGSSLFALIDDVVSILDDVAALSKVAAKKTTGVLGDDLALNAQQLNGISADRELPIIYKVFKGSLVNKIILVPLALLISYYLPVLIQPLLMIGGAFLCYEGMEKIIEKLLHKKNKNDSKEVKVNVVEVVSEENKIKGAVRTDFVLSAEIIVIALGTVSTEIISKQILTLSFIALTMTIGVYGFVALIIKLDDFGLFLSLQKKQIAKKIGLSIIAFAPWLLKSLGVIGTVAMFMVGGGILAHGIHLDKLITYPESLGYALESVLGVLVGTVLVGIHLLYKKSKLTK